MQPKIINILTSKKLNLFFVFVCSAFFACFGCISNSFATEVDFTGEPVSHQVTIDDFYSRWNSSTSYTRGRVHTGAFNEITRIEFYPYICYQLPVGAYYMEVNYNLGATNAVSNNSLWYGGPTYAVYNADSSIMPFLSSDEVASTTSGLTYRSYRSIFKYAGGTLLCNNATITMSSSGGMFATESYRITSVVFWKVNNSGASNQDIINSINSQSQALSDINNGIQDTNDKLDDVNDNLQDLRSSQEQANDDANDRYEDEKDTISGNGQDAQDSADSLDMSFGVPWILSAWYSLFIDSNCASIPTIKSWIHSTETQVCSPWPSAVRSTLTPIFSVLSGLLLFGFVIRWLKGGMFNNSIEVG